MTKAELLEAIAALPKELQFALASSVLERLAAEGPPPISERLKAEFRKREETFLSYPRQGESWESVSQDVFGK